MEPASEARLATIHALPTAQERRRPRHRRLQVAAGLTLVAAMVAAGLGVRSWAGYRPRFGPIEGWRYDGPQMRELHPLGGGVQKIVEFEPGQPLTVGFLFANRGSRAIDVLGFPEPWEPGGYLHRTGVWVGAAGGGNARTPLPFAPFHLGPGQVRYVELRYRFTDCPLERPAGFVVDPSRMWGGIVLTTTEVRYRYSRFTRTEHFDLPAALGVEGAVGPCHPPNR